MLLDWSELPHSEDGVIRDIQDASMAKDHPGLSGFRAGGAPRRLGFAAYADDVEVVNPIGGARVKHKVTLYYATILNIPWHMRSCLDHIYLVGVVLSKTQRAVAPSQIVQGIPRTVSAIIELNVCNLITASLLFNSYLICLYRETLLRRARSHLNILSGARLRSLLRKKVSHLHTRQPLGMVLR